MASNGLEVTKIGADGSVRRETFKAEVFRQGWRPPTMSLEELAEIEYRDAMARQKKEAEVGEKDLKYKQLEEQGLEDDMERVDKASVRDRDWDDWTDANPRGNGITKRF